jgi:hypothetical protein
MTMTTHLPVFVDEEGQWMMTMTTTTRLFCDWWKKGNQTTTTKKKKQKTGWTLDLVLWMMMPMTLVAALP